MLFIASRRSSVAPAILAGAWSGISAAFPASTGTNEDRAITWAGGNRTVTADYAGGGTLSYRINAGSWTTYAGGFSLASGQTVAWRIGFAGDETGSVSVSVHSRLLASFPTTATGFP